MLMATLSPLDDPVHWGQRAQEARNTADQIVDPIARQTMLEIAEAYARLAAVAERRRISKE
jgi:hypothetical protein